VIRRRLALHLSVLLVGAAIVRVAVVPAEVCPEVTATEVQASVDATIDWIIGNQGADGRFLYGWDREIEQPNTSYNEARHAGVTMSLYQADAVLGHGGARAAADRALGVALADLFEGPDWVAWRVHGDPQTGSNGLLLAALALRRQTTGDVVHDEIMRGIGRFLLAVQQSDGSVASAWDLSTGEPRPTFSPFSTGEASWALALLDDAFPGEGWGEAAARTVDYMATDRNAREGHLASVPDHWAAYTISDLRPDLLTDDRIDYARRLAGYFGVRLRFESQRRGSGLNLWVRWYPGPPAGVGTAGEGIGAIRRLAAKEPRLSDLVPAIDDRLRCMSGYQIERQVLDPGTRPEEHGAWFYREYTQMDDQQHMLSALLSALMTMEEDA
jgi:hypothetical protein